MFYFSKKVYIVVAHWKHKMVPMSNHNINFQEEISKSTPVFGCQTNFSSTMSVVVDFDKII